MTITLEQLERTSSFQTFRDQCEAELQAERDQQRKPLAARLKKLDTDFARADGKLKSAEADAAKTFEAATVAYRNSPGEQTDIDLRQARLDARQTASERSRNRDDYTKERRKLVDELLALAPSIFERAEDQLESLDSRLSKELGYGAGERIPAKRSKAELRLIDAHHHIRSVAWGEVQALKLTALTGDDLRDALQSIAKAIPHIKAEFRF